MEGAINFDGVTKPSRLSNITCEGFDNSSGQAAKTVKTKTYVTPNMEPRFHLDMEAKGSIPLWGITRTNSLLLMAESEAKRNSIKDLIAYWRLGGKMLIPARYNNSCEILCVFNTFPMYLVGMKIFNDYLSLADPMYGFKNIKIFNMKSCVTERPELCKKTGHSVFERQIIIARQLDCGPAMLYISNFMKTENLKEGLRYQVRYSDRDYEDSESELSAQPTPFNYYHDSLDVRKNWVPLDGQTSESADNDFSRWVNMVVTQDQLYLQRLESSEKLEVLAITNRKNEKKLPANAKRIFDLETYTFDQESTIAADAYSDESFRRSELGTCSTIRSVQKVKGVSSKSRSKKAKKSFSTVAASANQMAGISSFAIAGTSASKSRPRPRSPVISFNNSFFGGNGAENLINWKGRNSVNRTLDKSDAPEKSGISLLDAESTWNFEDAMTEDSMPATNSTPITEAARK